MEQRPINDISYRRYVQEEKLMGSQCTACSARFLPPRPICPECRSASMEWKEFEGKGKLVAFTCITVVPPAMAAQGYGRNNPYCSGVVELEEGVRVDARIEGIDPQNPETILIGTTMIAMFPTARGDRENAKYLAFGPA